MLVFFKMAASKPVDVKSLPRAELDVLYSPSCWSKKLGPEVVVQNFIKVVREATQNVKDELTHSLDVAYGDGSPRETIDIYYPCQDCTEDQSVVIFIHGGYWTDLGKEDYGFVCRPLVKKGITVAMVEFDNAPKGTMTTIVDQCRRACLHIAQTFPHKRLYLSGHSAGSHLCACMLSTDWSSLGRELVFHGALLLSGVYDLDPIRHCYVNDPLNLTKSEVMDYSPQRLIDRVKGNLHAEFWCLLVHGDQESPKFKRQGREYNEGLVSVGVASSVWEVEDEDHFTVVARLYHHDYSVTQRFVELIKSKQ